MRNMKKLTLLLLIMVLSLSITGCWGKKELGEIAIVTVIGIDVEPNGDLRLTALTREPIGSSEVQAVRSSTLIRSVTGRSIMDARNNLLKGQGKEPIWSHNKIIIIGEDLAKEGLDRFVDFFARNREFRLDTSIIIAEGRAEDILQQPSGVQASLAEDLDSMVENSKVWSEDYVLSLKDFLIKLLDKKQNAVTAMIGIYNSPLQRVSTNRESFRTFDISSIVAKHIAFKGSNILKKGKYVGELDFQETKGVAWMRNEVKGGILVFDINGRKGNASVEPVNSTAKLVLNTDEEKISFTVEVEATGFLSEITSNINVGAEEIQKEIEMQAAQAMIVEMKAAIDKSQKEYKVDVFGFAQTLYREYPQIWKKIGDDWDEIYPDIEIKYDVNFKLARIGLLHNTTSIE